MRKRFCILLAAIAIIGLQAAANSATLQAGWYVNINPVDFSWYDRTGTCMGPTATSVPRGHVRSVPGDRSGCRGDAVAYSEHFPADHRPSDPGSRPHGQSCPAVYGGVRPARLQVGLRGVPLLHRLHPSQMYTSLWQVMSDGTDVCLWSQMNGGVKGGGGDIDLSVISQNYYFLVTVVPETSGLVAILVGLCAAASGRSGDPRPLAS